MPADPTALHYRLCVHPRARRLRLRVERDGALVVTAPKGVRRVDIDRFVRAQEDWIEGRRRHLADRRSGRDPALCGPRPLRIELPAIDECWQVVYGDSRASGAGRHDASVPMVRVPADAPDEFVARHLQAWLKQRARTRLAPRVEVLAVLQGMRPGRLSFRNQRSRWGSCSSQGNLSLNARLLFCSPGACDYVLIHELVHLEHPNHSRHFWQRVEALCPDFRQHMRELQAVWHRLPDWVVSA